MKMDWKRVARTAIQSASGAGIALVTAISADFSRESILTALIGAASTVIIAVLMNIQKQAEEE